MLKILKNDIINSKNDRLKDYIFDNLKMCRIVKISDLQNINEYDLI